MQISSEKICITLLYAVSFLLLIVSKIIDYEI